MAIRCLDHASLIQQIAERLHKLCIGYGIPDEAHEYNWICNYVQDLNANTDTDPTKTFMKLYNYARWHLFDLQNYFYDHPSTIEMLDHLREYGDYIQNFYDELQENKPMFESEE